MMTQSAIADSAFLVNELRARNPSLSLDRYAHLWVNDRTREICRSYDQEVYPDDEVALGVRNRFFLNLIETFFQRSPEGVFVNLGAGFTNYPFLVKSPIEAIEIDLPHVISYKKNKLLELERSAAIPNRQVNLLDADFNDDLSVNELEKKLSGHIRGRRCFFLLEGLTYYLKKSSFDSLVRIITKIQKSDSILAMDFWPPEIKYHATCKKFRDFLEKKLNYKNESYNFIEPNWLGQIPEYKILQLTDVLQQQEQYLRKPILTKEYGVLDSYVVFQKI